MDDDALLQEYYEIYQTVNALRVSGTVMIT